MSTQNPYEPSKASTAEAQTSNPISFGLRVGVLFASPFLLAALSIFALCALRHSWNDLWLIGLPLPLGVAIWFSGGWWGHSYSKKGVFTFITIAVIQGFLQSLIFFASATLFPRFLKGFPKDLPNSIGVIDILFTVMSYSLWALALGLVIKWRLNKRLLLNSSQNA